MTQYTKPRTRRRTNSSTVDRGTVIDTAVRIADHGDLGTLTMRRLASEVGIPTMTLYGLFSNKEDLLDAIAEHVLGRFEAPDPTGLDRAGYATALGRALLAAMVEHPSIAILFGTRTTTTIDASHAFLERPIDGLVAAGFTPAQAVRVYGLLINHSLGFAMHHLSRPWGRDDGDADVEDLRRRRALQFQALPARRFPRVIEVASDLVCLPSLDQFEWGLSVLVAGLATADDESARS